jgi:hypothetical protein
MSSEPMHKITVKVGDALRTIQADTHAEFMDELEKAHESLQQCYDLLVAARAVGNVAQTPAPAPVQATATAEPAAPSAFTNASVPQCQHGPKTPKAGASAKGPWKAWMCTAPKGDPSQCAPQWIQRGTPEWNNFPA